MTVFPHTIEGYTKQIRRELPSCKSLFLRFGKCLIQVESNTSDVHEALVNYFSPFVTPSKANEADVRITVCEGEPPTFVTAFVIKTPDPGKTKIKEEFLDLEDGRIVRKRLTGMVFFFSGKEHLAVGPCSANLNQVVNFINNRFIWWDLCRGSLLGHAAAVTQNGRGLALAGFSGAGKSTLALHIMAHGAVFVSNDRLMIRPRGETLTMSGVAKLPRINPGTILNNSNLSMLLSEKEMRAFAALSKEKLWNLEQKYDVPIDTCFGADRFELFAQMDGLVILNWKHEDLPTQAEVVYPEERIDLLPAFMKATGLFFPAPDNHCRMPEPTIGNYIEMLSRCTLIEISGGVNFHQATRACLRFLETGSV